MEAKEGRDSKRRRSREVRKWINEDALIYDDGMRKTDRERDGFVG